MPCMDVLPPGGISSHCESVSHRINVYDVYEVISVRPLFLFGETHVYILFGMMNLGFIFCC